MKTLLTLTCLALLAVHCLAAESCEELYTQGDRTSGVKTLTAPAEFGSVTFSAYCNQDIEGGGWMLSFKQFNHGSLTQGEWDGVAGGELGHAELLHTVVNTTTVAIVEYHAAGSMLFQAAADPDTYFITPGMGTFDRGTDSNNLMCFATEYQDQGDYFLVSPEWDAQYHIDNETWHLELYKLGLTSAVLASSGGGLYAAGPQCYATHCASASVRHGRYNGECVNGAAGIGDWLVWSKSSRASSLHSCDVASIGNTTDNEPVLDTAASGISNDVVTVVFTESAKYENTQFFFGSSTCGAVHFTWQESSVDSATCATTWTGTASWADFTANCDLIRTESAIESVDHIIYQANFHITHTETFDGLRPGDNPITRTLTQYMPFEVRLPTSVTATTSPVRIFAPVVVEAAILEQGVSGTPGGDMTGRVGFLTSVQYPFRLGSVTGVTTPAGVATSDADPSTWVGHGEVGTCNDDSAAPCTQFFEWSFSPATGAICELDGEYNVTLEVECQASQVNDCPLDPNPGSVTLSFTLDTTDFCIELVDDLSVSASLETYLSDDFLVVKHDFIDGQRIYAQAPAQAEVSLSSTKVVQVSLVRPDASEIFFLNQGSPALTTEGTQVGLVTVDGGAVGPAQNSLPSFNFLADSELFGIAADQSDFITLKARVELSYDNAGQAKRESRDLEWTVQATTSSGTVATSFAMSGSNAIATQGTGTSASTSPASAATVAGVNVLFMGAALVVMCTVLVAAVVISRGRAKIDALREQLATKVQA